MSEEELTIFDVLTRPGPALSTEEREEVKKVLKSDDASDLFNLANNFGIRHHRKGQKTDYDQSIWLSWMFYYYLATIHACVRLVEKGEVRATTPTAPTVSNRMKGAP